MVLTDDIFNLNDNDRSEAFEALYFDKFGRYADASKAGGLYCSGSGVKGPNDNWAYINRGSVQEKICIGTYGAHDTIYWKTYWNEYRWSHCDTFVMSAGQKQTGSFKVRVWDSSNRVVCHLDKVFFRDFVHVGRNRSGRLCVAHGKGELWGTGGGEITLHP